MTCRRRAGDKDAHLGELTDGRRCGAVPEEKSGWGPSRAEDSVGSMCGIAGCVVRRGTSPSRERLEAMRSALAHRGPDDSGVEILDNVGLVHTRLAIVDVSERAHQPMHDPDRRWWLSFNGEIFNHRSIRGDLVGESFVSEGDTETLLHALARFGPTVLPRLNGQFAFAAVDLVAGRLLLARDRFGIKPLYVACCDDGIWFASEPAALLAAGVTPLPRPEIWRSVLDGSCYPGDDTLLQDIRRLAPGSCLEIALDTSSPTLHRWDSPASHVDAQRQRQLGSFSRAALVSKLEGTLRAAVHDALLGDVAMGTLCSGGVDSSLVTALAVEVKPDLVAFAARYKGDPALDEGPAARRVTDALGIELDMLEVTEPVWRSGFVAATLHFGGPLATASAVTISQMAERARLRNVKVLLTGEGADELFAGYGSLHADRLAAFLSNRHRATRRLEPVVVGFPLEPLRVVQRRLSRLAGLHAPSGPTWSSVLGPESDHVADDPAATAEVDGAYMHHVGPRMAVEKDLLLDLDLTLSHLLNRMDKNMMHMSVEARVPFLDPRVVELALNLPLEARVTPWSKGILRDVARGLLPWRIAHRPKIYGMDFEAGAWIEEAADPRFLARGVFTEVFGISRREFADVLAVARGGLRVRLWSAEVWCRSVFAGESAQTIEKDLWPHGP